MERPDGVPEAIVQCIWYDQLFNPKNLKTTLGKRVAVVSPGWWNHGEGPDFRGAQIRIGEDLKTGDVEVHVDHRGWRAHGHDTDTRYGDVILHVLLDAPDGAPLATTPDGLGIPTIRLSDHLAEDIESIADRIRVEDYPYRVDGTPGRCAALVEAYGSGHLTRLLELAGDWRMVFKARAIRLRADRVGLDQAAYESLLYACGYGHFKFHFRALAEQLHYERARQLAREDPLLLEGALLQLAGLLPEESSFEGPPPHLTRLHKLRRERFAGLRHMPLTWRRVGVRPTNYPERRISGVARLIARTASAGLLESLERVWARECKAIERRRAFENLFPRPMGFWATRCTWTGKTLARPAAMIGAGRVRSIIGNVFVPLELARARENGDRLREERVMEFFAALPQEPNNHIQKIMVPRLFADTDKPRLNFRLQQGLLQFYQDWCRPNPSCRNCRVIPSLDLD
jgi:hypothetical protein